VQRLAEKEGFFNASSYPAKASDLRPLVDVVARDRVRRLIERDSTQEMKPSPAIAALLPRLVADADKYRKREALVQKEVVRLGSSLPLPGVINLGNKSHYPAYYHPDIQSYSRELMLYGAEGVRKNDIPKLARWKMLRAAIDATSFWSSSDEVRNLVAELDLDPMAHEFNHALWKNCNRVYVERGSLRQEAIKLWNKGAVFLSIRDMKSPTQCWNHDQPGEAPGYSISYGSRRKLPLAD